MQHYLDHVERSRQRLGKIVKRLSEPANSSVLIRGTALQEPSVDAILRVCENHGSIPFYVGTLSFFGSKIAAILLDASLRKSISFALMHLYKQIPTSASVIYWEDAFYRLFSEAQLKKPPCLALVLFHLVGLDMSHIHADIRGRDIFQVAEVGDAYVPTLLDRDMQSSSLPCYRLLWKSTFVSLPPSAVLASIQIAAQSKAQEEMMQFKEKIDKRFIFNINPKTFEFITAFKDDAPSVEGLKQRNFPPIIHRFCIEIEIAMMERMLDELEK